MKRLSRLNWVYDEHPVYFVTSCTHAKRPLLNNTKSHEVFVEFCKSALNRRVHVGKYVLMPDHFHLFVCFGIGAPSLSTWMKSLKNYLSKHWRAQNLGSPHWQKGYFDHVIRNEESHSEKWSYVRDNPVRANLAQNPESWPFAGEISRL